AVRGDNIRAAIYCKAGDQEDGNQEEDDKQEDGNQEEDDKEEGCRDENIRRKEQVIESNSGNGGTFATV
ncbi:MAG: hypothetical protein IIB35_14580, partial [Gemmatimonadetes bacterium]|nr:hypothetical protein [Gemmatimonadota bacterium]